MTAGVYTPRGTSTSATLPQGVYHVKCYESSGTSVRFLSVYSSAGCQLGQQEVPGGGEQGAIAWAVAGPRLGRTTLPRPMRASCC
jgi:hypothetical protein